jgi:purine-binding chemotaxis protein CheW
VTFDAAARRRLADRARELALPLESTDEELPELRGQLLIVRVAGDLWALPTERVTAVAALRSLTTLPGAPPLLAGIATRNGTVLPVFDLREALGLALGGLPERSSMVVVSDGAEEIGLALHSIERTEAVPSHGLSAASATLRVSARRFVLGATPEGIPVLDLAALLASPVLHVGPSTTSGAS